MGANINTSRPETAQKLLDWGKWYLDVTGADGFRMDAIKHISHNFIPEWICEMRAHKGDEDMFVVGEYWSAETERLLNYLDEVDNMYSLFDVPLHHALHDASVSTQYDMRGLFGRSLMEGRPDNAVTFTDNHDTQAGQALMSPIEPWFRQQAYAAILFQKAGIPCVFFGDLYGIPHDNLPAVEGLRAMCRSRHSCAHGTQQNYYDDPHVIGYTRAGVQRYKYSGMAVMITNDMGGSKSMYVNVKYKNERFINILDPDGCPVDLDDHGYGCFYVKDRSAAVWIRECAKDYILGGKELSTL